MWIFGSSKMNLSIGLNVTLSKKLLVMIWKTRSLPIYNPSASCLHRCEIESNSYVAAVGLPVLPARRLTD